MRRRWQITLRSAIWQSLGVAIIAISWAADCAFASTRGREASRSDSVYTLEDCIAVALERNFDIRLSRLDLNNAVQEEQIARAAFDPVLSSQMTKSGSQAAEANSELQGSAQPESKTVQTSFSVDQHLFTGAQLTLTSGAQRFEDNSDFSLLNPSYDADYQISLRQPLLRGGGLHVTRIPLLLSRIEIQQATWQQRKSVVSTIAAVETAYWNVILARKEEEFSRQDLNLSEKLVSEVKVRMNAGLSNGLDALSAETDVASKQEALISSGQAIANRIDVLFQLLGAMRFDGMRVAESSDLPLLGVGSTDIAQEIAMAEATDPDYQVAKQAIERNRLNVDQAKNNLLPQVDLIAGSTYAGRSGSYDSAYRGALNGTGHDWSVGFEARVPWGFREERARLQQARNGEASASLQAEETAQKLTVTVRAACRAVEAGQQRVKASAAALRLSEERYTAAKSRFDEGLAEYRDVVDAQENLANAKLTRLRARVDLVRAEIELSRLDGTLLTRHHLDWKSGKPSLSKR